MARRCSICSRQDAEQINRALIGNTPLVEIAARTGLAQSSLSRHRSNHLAPQIANALARFEEVDAERLVAWAVGLNERTLYEMAAAKAEGDPAGFRALLGEARKNLELIARLAGVLDAPTITVDARRQLAIVTRLGALSEAELRALARGEEPIEGVARELPALEAA
jgi:hypothetical protein